MSIFDVPLVTLQGQETSLAEHKGKALLIVNVASRCGFTPQYEGLRELHERYAARGFTVLGFPCNQFGGQEPGTAEEIQEFCSLTYGIDFPIFDKVEVNGENRHPIFEELTQIPDEEGKAGDVRWNFEKFLISPDGEPVGRFRTMTTPEQLAEKIEPILPD